MRAWHSVGRQVLFAHRLFALEREQLADREGATREAMLLRAPDWVNVVALVDPDHVVLVRQWRFGIAGPTLEIPGGMVDDGETAEAAAARELWEETGYRARRWDRLGEVEPNPAFLTNRTETWLARDLVCEGPPVGDGDEEIEVEVLALDQIPGLIARGEIRHALVICGFHFFYSRAAEASVPSDVALRDATPLAEQG